MSFNIQNLKQKANTRLFDEIRKAAGIQRPTAENLILENNRQILLESQDIDVDVYDIFLSHSSRDAQIILGILEKLNNLGYSVYVDWVEDPQLDRNNVTKKTANTLRLRMKQSKSLLYATTEHASNSKWMPWELGYMDGQKDKASILPIFETEVSSSDSYKGQEYLGVYPYCIEAKGNIKRINKLWIHEKPDIYISFDQWLAGKKPYKH